jgi:hypothetical protein
MNGQLVCKNHGAKTPAALATGRQRLAMREVLSRSSRIVAYDGDDPQTPEDGLLFQIRWSGQVARSLAEAVEALVTDQDMRTKSSGAGQQIHALLRMWTDERALHAKLCALALNAGVAQRSLDLVEAQANMIAAAMLALLQSPALGLSADQVMAGRIVAAEILRSLPGAPQALPMPMPQ